MAASSLSPGSADVLRFDLGRVVLDTDFERVMARWAADAGCQPADLASRFVVNDSFKHHETGKIDDAAFFADLRASLGIGLTDAQFLEGWNAIFAGEMPGIAPLLAGGAERKPLSAVFHFQTRRRAPFSESEPDGRNPVRARILSGSIWF